MIDDMYQEIILEHYKQPSNFGKLEKYSNHYREVNPTCGDEVEIFLMVKDGKVEDVKFFGQGCVISTAASSMLTENIKGKSVEEIKKLGKEDVFKMLGIPISYAREKCALLSLNAVSKAFA